ncbi:heterokaryon incompatibility [Fusarium sporotrichioides]|uniref:Heterokaryon incompatibility n=1 Tax=Fusarium sporotrichioides TaxID=5514 RepID=A0A395RQP9_FUSSP|nr:heterokaryon incompatibility [Fusarium sporotrichioides]
MNPSIVCAENISLLFLLHSFPSVPKATPIRKDQTNEAGYSLPFEKERELASTLAFLSTVNKSSFDDGNTDLSEMNRALSEILSQLTDTYAKPDAVDSLLGTIVAVCTERILSRLHLRSINKQKVKKPIDETLRQAVSSLRQLREKISNRRELMNSASVFEDMANKAVKLITAWTKHQTTARLRDIVEGIHKIWMIERLDELLNYIPNNLMDPNLRSSLHNIIRKVARYKEAARHLCRMAKKFPAVQRAEVISVTLQREMFAKTEVNHYSPSLPTTLQRIYSKHNLAANTSRIYSLLKLGAAQAEQMFSHHVLRSLEGAKVHAEIQLFYHIEMLHPVQLPRVVCSSKDACYLCDYFITTTTKLHSPKCHGRLYPGWRLPAVSTRDQTLERFNHHLEEEVCKSIRNLLRKKKKFSLPEPRESTILTIRRSVSTLAPSPIKPDTVDAIIEDDDMSPEKMAGKDSNQDTVTHSKDCLQVARDVPEHSVTSNDENPTKASNAPQTSHDQSQTISPCGSQSDAHQKDERKLRKLITGCVDNNDMSCIRVGPLTLYVEYSASHNGTTENVRRDLRFDVEWITDANDRPTKNNVGSNLVDIETSTYTASLPLNVLNQLDIYYRGHVWRVRLHS